MTENHFPTLTNQLRQILAVGADWFRFQSRGLAPASHRQPRVLQEPQVLSTCTPPAWCRTFSPALATLLFPLLQGFQRFTILMCSDATLHVEFQTTWREIKDG